MKLISKDIILKPLIALLCLSIVGCGQAEPIIDSNETESNNDYSSVETLKETTPLRMTIQKIYDGFVGKNDPMPKISDIALLCLTEDNQNSGNLEEICKDKLPVYNGDIHLDLNLLVYSQKDLHYMVSGTLVLIWNGQIYDFSVDGKQSQNGSLSVDIPYNEDVILPFEVNDLPIQKGDNFLHFCFIPYCKETGIFLTPQKYTAHYWSDRESAGIKPVAISTESDLSPENIHVIKNKEEAAAFYNVQESDRISSNDDTYALHPNPTFLLNISNLSDSNESSNRSGIAMCCADGNIQPVWNGNKYAAVSVSEGEYRKTIAFDTNYLPGEKHDVCMIYVELEDDKCMDNETFIYGQACYCTIKE